MEVLANGSSQYADFFLLLFASHVYVSEFRTFFPQKAEENTVRGHLLTAMSISPLEFDRFHLAPPVARDGEGPGVDGGEQPEEAHTDVTFSLLALRVCLCAAFVSAFKPLHINT